MTTAEVVETSVTVNNTSITFTPDDHAEPTYQMDSCSWAQLFEGRLALTLGKISTRVSFYSVQKDFSG